METNQEPRILELTHAFRNIPETAWGMAPESGKWSRKQILGHLVDSAANNLQRFVRIQFEESSVISYTQDQWVTSSYYDEYDIANLIDLWFSLNSHLLHIISHTPAIVMHNTGIGADGTAHTLAWYIHDYFKHLEHHVTQILCA